MLQWSMQVIEKYIYGSEKHPFASCLAAKHPKTVNWA